MTSEDSIDAAFSRARGVHGQERILVNCAGTGNAVKTVSRDETTGEIRHYPNVYLNGEHVRLDGAIRMAPR